MATDFNTAEVRTPTEVRIDVMLRDFYIDDGQGGRERVRKIEGTAVVLDQNYQSMKTFSNVDLAPENNLTRFFTNQELQQIAAVIDLIRNMAEPIIFGTEEAALE